MNTLQNIFQEYKGILAADERPSSMDKRLAEYGIEPGEEMRNRYRELLFSTPNLERSISGVILSEDVFSDHTTNGTLTREHLANLGIAPGVKVDGGLEPYRDDLSLTKGLEELPEKCARYTGMGAAFAKWRSVIPVTGADDEFIAAVAENQAEYARICLEHNLVPIVEPEVLLKGEHSIEDAAAVLERVLTAMLAALNGKGCNPHHCILKSSFATPGLDRGEADADTVARETLRVFKKIGMDSEQGFYGVAFLSGGLSADTAIAYIQRIRVLAESEEHSFRPPLTFSYARALQTPALSEWKGEEGNATKAQVAFTGMLQRAGKKYKGDEEVPSAGSGDIGDNRADD